MKIKKRILILGDGAWGTALALVLARNGHKVTLWSNFPEYAQYLLHHRKNTTFLPGIKIPSSIQITSERNILQKEFDLWVSAVPTVHLRTVLRKISSLPISPAILKKVGVVSISKGIEQKTLKRPSEIINEVLGVRKLCILSGPSHAEEVARCLPTCVVATSRNRHLTQDIQQIFMNNRFRVYTHYDTIGVELGGALKNVIAIAAGICEGLKLGDNARAALLSRGIIEMARLGTALGAKKPTFFGLTGIGDLITTCASPYGRNRSIGLRIGRGETLARILKRMKQVAEGVWTTRAVFQLAKRHRIEMPITQEVYKVLFKTKKPIKAMQDLMQRTPKSETMDL